jgi:hypothetical protein
MDCQDLAESICHRPIATTFVLQHNWCCRGGGIACSMIRANACTDCS